ncbi:MAG: cytochrome c [Rhodobacteraceae bacterium]|nr:cytochrome c [Paracoccaceae bacterium]
MIGVLRNEAHQYTEEMISDDQARRIGMFVTRGLHDTDAHIDRETGDTTGSAARGANFFQNICAACHGFQGTQLDWGDDSGPAYIGTESNANPWEVLHKIRNGHPGVEMISSRPFGMETAVDILTYVRTLPEK